MLNSAQQSAVNNLEGAVLILAGAGTGKTSTITARIANLVLSGVCLPHHILAVTFTNKAAKEMKERIESHVDNCNGMWVGTFHGLSLRILRMYYKEVGLNQNFIILDDTDRKRVLKNLIKELEIDETRFSINVLSFIISGLKENGIKPFDSNAISDFKYNGLDIEKVYNTYHTNIRQMNAVDFDDLIFECVNLFKNNPTILSDLQERFRYIIVDEYQDTNKIQHQWLHLLASKYRNICCVGDEDQSIYGWRGAEIKHILNFPKEFPEVKIINLEENYRSTQQILNAAMSLIGKNKNRYSKTLFSSMEGTRPEVLISEDDRKECYAMVRKITELSNVAELKKMAILVRASYQMKNIEDVFIKSNLSYKIVDGTRFYDRKEIKDLMCYLRFSYSSSDAISFERIINTPKRGIGEKSILQILNSFNANRSKYDNNLLDFLCDVDVISDIVSPKILIEIQNFTQLVSHWQDCIKTKSYSVREIADLIYNKSGYAKMLKSEAEENPAEVNRIENVREFISSLEQFANMEEFLEYVALLSMSDDNNSEDAVNIMTIHAAKGLEFDYVFLPCWDEDLFPNKRAIEESGDAGLEEERRLAYVAITRAKKMLYIYSSKARMIFGKFQFCTPSRFIRDIQNDVRIVDKSKVAAVGMGTSLLQNAQAKPQTNINYKIDKKTSINKKVSHAVFGNGVAVNIEGDFYEVQFDSGVVRKIKKDFLIFL
jgi:DNA helicase-2/ATP-dependent DNA helicase PcrA